MTAARVAWGLCLLIIALLVASLVLTLLADDVSLAFDLVSTLALLTLPVVGALVAARRAENAIGWLFLGAGVLFATSGAAHGWMTYTLVAQAGALPGGTVAAWLNTWVFLPALFGTPALLFLLFPDGRPLSRRWRPAVWFTGVAMTLQATGAALRPGQLEDAPAGLENPIGLGLGDVIEGFGWAFGLASIFVAVAALLLRFRRARGVERLQLKWFVSAAVLFGLSCVAGAVLFTLEEHLSVAGQLVIVTAFATIPLAAGVAILRRLYDVDLVISRTLVYGALTAVLAAAYLAMVLLLGLALGQGSPVAVAVSTLAVAALFRPARARIQAIVDRRFYRRRYDAARTLDAFATRLRDEVELDAVIGDLRAAAGEALQPTHVSVWLR